MIPHKKALVLQELTPETDRHYFNFEYETRKLTDNFLFMRERDPYNALGSKLRYMYVKLLIGQEVYSQYEEGMVKDLNFIISMIKKMKTRRDYYNMSKTCTILLHVLNSDTSWHQLGDLWKQEELTCLLSDLLSLLPEELFHEVSLEKAEMMNSSERFFSIKTYTYIDLLFKLLWCGKQINEGHADSNIVIECLNYYYMEKCQGSIVEFTAQILNIICCLPENSFIKVILQGFLRKNLKTVTSMAILTPGYDRSGQIVNLNSTAEKSKKGLIYTQCASILSGNKMTNVDIKQYARKLNIKGPEDENEVETVSGQVKLLVLCILLLLVTALGNKSAKLKKYLALKYEYDKASLYLLWCSGDIEVHPGPPWKKKQLEHDSEKKRKWLQDINSILLKLYWGLPTQSKPKTLWQIKPDHWPDYKPFHDTKNTQSETLSDEEILTVLLECLVKKNIVIPKQYQCEISAWRNKMIQLLHKLQVLRIGTDNAKSAILNLLLVHIENEVKGLKDIKVSLENSIFDNMETEDLLKNDKRQKKQAEMVADIIRDLISKLCRLSRGKDLAEKCDGIWNHPAPEHWPGDVPFLNPYNRGKYPKTCPDSKLLITFLQLPHMKIPENLKQIVDAYINMLNCTDIEVKKKNKDELCRLFTIQSNVTKLENALQYMHEEGLFSREVYAILNQWQTTEPVDEQAERVLKNANGRTDDRPPISIKITKNSQDTDLRDVTYIIPINNAFLHIQCITIPPNQLSQENPITRPLITTHSKESTNDSVIPPDIFQFLSDYDFCNQTELSNDKLVSVKDKNNGPETSGLEWQRTVLSATNAYQETQTILDTLTNQSSDIDRFCMKYGTTCPQTGACDSKVNDNILDNLGNGDSGALTVKKRKFSNSESAKKQQKTKFYQNCAEPNDSSASNELNICSNDVLDSLSLNLSMNDQMNDMRDKCESQILEDYESDEETCNLESTESSNPQDSLENNDDVENNQNIPTDDKELENCLDLVNYLSWKPSEIETFLSQQSSIL